MTSEQIRSLVISTEDRICARLYRRADGTVITRDCPVGLRALRSRVSKAAAAFAAILSICTGAIAQSSLGKNQSCAHTSQLQIKRTASKKKQVTLTGVIKDEMGAVIPGVSVSLTRDGTKQNMKVSTTAEGEFSFPSLSTGAYRVEIKANGFQTLKLKHLAIDSNEEARAEIVLKIDGESVTVGIIVDSPMIESSNGTTIIRGDMIRKLPMP
jgi:hypothetical protein